MANPPQGGNAEIWGARGHSGGNARETTTQAWGMLAA